MAAIGILLLAACSSSTSDVDPTTTIASPVTTSPVTTSPATTSPVTTSPPAPSATTEAPPEPSHIVVTSSAYAEGGRIPVVHTCEGEDTSPDYTLDDLPAETVSVVLTMDDPDAPGGTWDHWVVFDMGPVTEIPIEAVGLGTMGSNSWDALGYGGPCPPPGNAHRYVVSVYALDGRLALDEGATKADVLAAMGGHILATGELTGEFSR
jgi:Raf kinase inhibitor-like YbhB/YbcL family protein